jgi:hypothetical protein
MLANKCQGLSCSAENIFSLFMIVELIKQDSILNPQIL